jgi:hypothetical protein
MDLKAELIREHSKAQTMKIRAYIGSDQSRFDKLMQLFLKGEYRVTQRAAWALKFCAEAEPTLILPHLQALVENLKYPLHDSNKRNTIKVLTFIEIPEDLLGELADICFGFLASPKEAIAIRVFSMELLFKICEREPDLSNELKLLIEDHYPHGSAGFKSKSRKVLKSIAKLQKESK